MFRTEFARGLSGCRPQINRSLIQAANLLFEQKGISFSSGLGNSFRQTVASIFSRPNLHAQIMLEPHIQETILRIEQQKDSYIVVAQDTTYLNYSGQKEMTGLGIIQGKILGLVQHNILAITDSGVPLGLLGQLCWTRKGYGAEKLADNESNKWFIGLSEVNRLLAKSDKKIMLVQDREADILTFFKAQRADNVDLIVRVFQPRKVKLTQTDEVFALQESVKNLPKMGEIEVEIFRERQAITLTLALYAAPIEMLPNKNLSPTLHSAKGLTFVVAREIGAVTETGKSVFKPEEAAECLLITTLKVDDAKSAAQIVRWYAMRWRIERFHYALKSGGFEVESLQFDDVQTQCNALAFYSILAWKVCFLIYQVRQYPEEPASNYFEQDEVKVLEILAKKKSLTFKEAILCIAKLLGFAPTKKQPLPGILKLTQALSCFNAQVQGFKLLFQNPY